MNDSDLLKLIDNPKDYLTVENASELLEHFICHRCMGGGSIDTPSKPTLGTFCEPNNNGTGIICRGCGLKHPLSYAGVMWLPRTDKPKRSNDIAAVISECGNYCYGCGTDFDTLRQRRIGRHVHHTRSFAKHGEKYAKIPLCALCHELISAAQRHMQKTINQENDHD
jgi:hypothetical protein